MIYHKVYSLVKGLWKVWARMRVPTQALGVTGLGLRASIWFRTYFYRSYTFIYPRTISGLFRPSCLAPFRTLSPNQLKDGGILLACVCGSNFSDFRLIVVLSPMFLFPVGLLVHDLCSTRSRRLHLRL